MSEETTEVLLQSLRDGRLDLGLASPPFPGGGADLIVEILMEDELLVTLPRRHPLCRRPAITVQDVMDSSQLETVLAMVESGLGITFTPRLAVPSFSHRRLTFRSIAPKTATRQIALIYPKQRSLTAADAIFRKECLAWRGASVAHAPRARAPRRPGAKA